MQFALTEPAINMPWRSKLEFLSVFFCGHFYSYRLASSRMDGSTIKSQHHDRLIVIIILDKNHFEMTFAAIYKIPPKSTILGVQDSWIMYEPWMLHQSWIWRILFLSRSFISFRIRATLYRSSWNLDTGTCREKQQLSVTVLQIRVLHLPKHRIQRPFMGH